MSEASGGGETQVNISNQLASLVPNFDPSKDDLQMYQRKVEMVLSVWPEAKISELVTRLILNTTGSAFAKLQLHHKELCTNEAKSIHKLIEYLGGHWGQTGLERRFADAEKALYQCSQQSDESHDSFLARADVLWSKLKSQKLQIDDLQAYITLRGANLPSEDKKRIILDSDNTLEGKLTINRVREAVRMLGTSFFQEMTGQARKNQKTKVYDSNTLMMEDLEHHGDHEDPVNAAHAEDWHEDEVIEALLAEGDDDAIFVADFEAAASEVLQTDDDLSTAYSTYVEARRKLNEKVRARGFWPLGKGKSKMSKGRGKGRPTWNKKSLQQRILESNCRLCGKKGHWKSECPNRNQGSSGSSHAAAATLSVASSAAGADDAMPAEFLELPMVSESGMKDSRSIESCLVQTVFSNECFFRPSANIHKPVENMRDIRDRIRCRIEGNNDSNSRSKVQSLVHRIEMKLQHRAKHPNQMPSEVLPAKHILCRSDLRDVSRSRMPVKACPKVTGPPSNAPAASPIHATAIAEADTWFASHDTWGILDTGATKTVMGSNHVKGFLKALSPEVKKQIQRTSCDIMFRFGNQGTLQAVHALVVPLAGMKLKIAVVEGATPFLVSNTLLRALGAMIDTSQNQLVLPKHHIKIPLKLSAKGLYLIDTNELFKVAPNPRSQTEAAETFAQDDHAPAKMLEDTPSAVEAKNVEQRPKVSGSEQSHAHTHMSCPKIDLSGTKAEHEVTSKASEIWPISNCLREPSARTSKNHGGLAAATESCPSSDAGSRRGVSESPDLGAAESHSNVVWQGSCGKESRDNMEGSSRLDQVVFQPLQNKPQDRAQEDDPVHPTTHRRGRKSGPSSLSSPSGVSQAKEHAEVICSQGKVPAGTSQPLADCRRIGDGRADDGASLGHHRDDRSPRRSSSHSQSPPGSRKCHAAGDCSDLRAGTELQRESGTCPSRNCSDRFARSMGTVEDHETHCDWSLQAGEIDQFCETIPNKEKEHFWNLVNRMEKEIDHLSKIVKPSGKQIDLLEVFCSEQSALSDQVQKLGGTAHRFGRAQGDLDTTEGRKALFVQLLKHRPKNVWMSPTCGPWCKWSQFNSLRSLSAFDSIQQQRFSMLIQVALCLVLCRYQHRQCRHAHWEQPKGSYMMRLPYIQEIYRYLLCTMPDLCNAGNLRDPVNKLLMQKGLHIMTSSQKLHESLHHLKCTRDHVHQQIEGSTQVHGRNVARSELSEIYPRKFGRLVAKTLLKIRFPMEKPVGSIADTALSIFDVLAAEAHAATVKERPTKRYKTVPKQGVKTPAAAGASD